MSVPKSPTRLPGEGSSHPFDDPPRGGLLPQEAVVFALADALLDLGAAGFAAGIGWLLPSGKRFKHDQLTFWLGDLLRPRDTPHSAAKISKLLHILDADRGNPRYAKLNCITRTNLLRRHVTQSVLRQCVGRWCICRRRGRGRHGYVPSAAAGGLLDAGQISDEQEQGGRRADERFQKEARVLRRAEREPDPRRPAPLFIHRTRCFGKPAVQQCRVRQRSHQKPPRNHFERGQRLHHLATSSAPDDLVELLPRRANVGAKAKTLPSAPAFVYLAALTGSRTTGEVHPSSSTLQDEGQQRCRPVPRPHSTWRPTWDSTHCNRPRSDKCVMGPICNIFSVITVCNPPLQEYSGDRPSA
jgi:hypothetical protein